MKTQIKKAKIKTMLKEMIFSFITIDTLLNKVSYVHTLVNLEYLCFSIMTKKTVKQNKLKWFSVPSQKVIDIMNKTDTINEMKKTHINIDEHIKIC